MQDLPSYARLLQRLGEGRTLIRYDQRGIGLSQRAIGDVTPEWQVQDPVAVIDALELPKVSIFAGGPAAPSALYVAAKHPDRILALVVFGAVARIPNASWVKAMTQMIRDDWFSGSRTLAGANLRHPPEDAARMADVYLRSTTGEVAARYMEDNLDFDLRPDLPSITARTLVMHSVDDLMYPFASGQEIAAGIPGARLFPVEGNRSVSSLGDKTDLVAEAVVSFLDEDPETRRLVTDAHAEGQAGLRTVLFTDLVGHTEMMQRLGDERGRDVLREHERITREVLKANGGTEVKTMGDGFMASFGSVTQRRRMRHRPAARLRRARGRAAHRPRRAQRGRADRGRRRSVRRDGDPGLAHRGEGGGRRDTGGGHRARARAPARASCSPTAASSSPRASKSRCAFPK